MSRVQQLLTLARDVPIWARCAKEIYRAFFPKKTQQPQLWLERNLDQQGPQSA